MVYSRGFGYADLEHRVPVDPITTKFRIASLSKPLTSAALGLLIDRGEIDIDAAVQRYLPSFPEHSQGQISARQLAGHFSGIRHISSQEAFSHEHFTSVTHALSVFKDDPLITAPGEAYYYSNYGFTLLSAVIEAAAGRDFLEFMNTEVFEPFGMQHTAADNIYDIIPNRAANYEADTSGTLVNARLADHSATWAAGGFLSSAEDMVRFGFGMLYSDILTTQSKDLLWTSQVTRDGEDTNYGMGWMVIRTANGDRLAYHTGGTVGGSGVFVINRDQNVVIAVLANKSKSIMPAELVAELERLFGDPH
jgi:CubicO group peptidase (beta-lactamase class C family)